MSGNARSRRRASAPSTSWDHLAAWYDGWVGDAGSRYHRSIAVPTTLDLLALRRGDRLIDLGCGQGVLAAAAREAGAEYLGVDASPRMIAVARRRHGRDGQFVVCDTQRLVDAPGVPSASFDAAAFLFSIQDMDDLDAVIAATAAVLRPQSRIVMFLTHPAFRAPRHSGWGTDPSRGLTFRRVDAYLTPMAVPLRGRPGAGPTVSFHRPLSRYVAALAEHGFLVDTLRELPDLPGASGNPDIPLFLALRAVRQPLPGPVHSLVLPCAHARRSGRSRGGHGPGRPDIRDRSDEERAPPRDHDRARRRRGQRGHPWRNTGPDGQVMASRLIALVEHPAQEQPDSRVEVQTRRRLRPPEAG